MRLLCRQQQQFTFWGARTVLFTQQTGHCRFTNVCLIRKRIRLFYRNKHIAFNHAKCQNKYKHGCLENLHATIKSVDNSWWLTLLLDI
jgi:hypothetical protein